MAIQWHLALMPAGKGVARNMQGGKIKLVGYTTAIVGVITNNLCGKIKLVSYTTAVVGVITNNLCGKIKLVGWIDKNIFANLYKR